MFLLKDSPHREQRMENIFIHHSTKAWNTIHRLLSNEKIPCKQTKSPPHLEEKNNSTKPTKLHIQQANCFYNYSIALDATEVDLIKTSKALLKSNTTRTIYFSDLKSIYLDADGEIQFELLYPQGRRWDENWSIKFSENLPQRTVEDLLLCLNMAFHERRIEGDEVKQVPPYLRAALPPIVLESDDVILPIYPWLKLHADGIMYISFQLDTTWDDLGEDDFINDIVNLFQRYFRSIWVDASLQKMDGELLLPEAYKDAISIGGHTITDRKTRKLIKKMQKTARETLSDSLSREGQIFDLHGEPWLLHQIAGSEDHVEWEGTIDICRSIYTNAIASQITPIKSGIKQRAKAEVKLWEGRPSISLMRFNGQPESKDELLDTHSKSLYHILQRSTGHNTPSQLPPDLRPFNDYCLHGNRSILLWTWLRHRGAPDNVWDEPNTTPKLLENQSRTEHFEYHNIRIARACAIAEAPKSDEQLLYAYKILASAESAIHKSSQAGEITDALEFMIAATGTSGLIASAKEQARWHLDERRYTTEKTRSRMDRWIALVFGVVGAAGMADLVFKPFLQKNYPDWADWLTGLVGFASATSIIALLMILISAINKIMED